jgi:transposase
MRSRKAATSVRGLGWYRNKSRPEIEILGGISKRGNPYLRALFVKAAWVVLIKVGPKHWERYGLESWIEAAKKRLHHNVLGRRARQQARPHRLERPGSWANLRGQQDSGRMIQREC